MTFTHLLHDLIGMVGANVTVTASAHDGHPVLAARGVMSGAVDVLDASAEEHEVLYFPITPYADTGFMITRSEFTGAQWHDDVLHVELGSVTLMIEPLD